MSKLKLKPGLIGVLLLGSFFAGWKAFLIISLLLLVLCEMNGEIKKVFVSIWSFYIAITIVGLLWQVITDGVDVLIFSFKQFIEFLNYYINSPIDIENINRYFIEPLKNILETLDKLVVYLLLIAKFSFVLCFLSKKTFNVPIVSKYVNKVLSFVDLTDKQDVQTTDTQANQSFNAQNNNFVNQSTSNNQQYVNTYNNANNQTQFNNNPFNQ